MASGMPGASRRAVLGGATYSVVKVWVRLSGAGRPRQRHRSAPTSLARVQRGGVNPGPCARGFCAMSHRSESDWPMGARLKLALPREYSTKVLRCVKEMDGPSQIMIRPSPKSLSAARPGPHN